MPVSGIAYILSVVGIQPSKSFFKRKLQILPSVGLCLALSISIVGCAAQSSYLDARRTEDLVQQAQKADPSSIDAEKARVAYEAGEVNLKEARYGRSTLYFKEAERLARRVLDQKTPIDLIAEPSDSSADLISDDGSSELVSTKKRPSLPAEALAAYLASKSASKMSLDDEKDIGDEIKAPKHEVLLPPKKLPRGNRGNEAAAATAKAKSIPAKPQLEEDGVVVVEASSEVLAKTPPVVPEEEEAMPEPTKLAKKENVDLKPAGPEKTKLDQIIPFSPKDEALNESSMAEMDKMSRFLVENPSNTLILRGVRGPSEGEELVAGRYDSVKSYLSARGVPDDQVRLEDSSISGRNPGFEMFLIEH